MKTLVTGGTGTLGRLVVPRLLAAGYDVRVLSRHRDEVATDIESVAGDLATGDGIEAAVSGTEIIIHCAGSMKGDEEKARHLVQAASQTGTGHLIYISVVGADRIPVAGRMDRAMFGYFGSKLAAEQIIANSGLPWTTLRATQFHELILMAVQQMARLPVTPVPAGFRFQPVDAGEVADRLVELALAKPVGLVPDIGGPRVYEMADLVRSYLRSRAKRRPILPVWLPGAAAHARRGVPTSPPPIGPSDDEPGRTSWRRE
jgi:uncharacterized protein YbjT (DUF2867 family)